MSILIRILNALLTLLGNQISNQRRVDAALAQQAEAISALQKSADRIETLLLLPEADHFTITADVEGHTTTGVGSMALTLTDSQKAALTIAPVDAKGAPASLDGAPVWASSDETIVTVAASADGLSAEVSAVRPGAATVTVTGDSLIGDGTTPIVGTLDVTVIAGQAVKIDITAGAPVDQ